jgi:hypothetical protein
LWRNQLRIGLCPDRLIVCAQRRGLKTREPHREILPVVQASDGANWGAALDALPAAIDTAGAEKLDVTVVLSNHFVRYALLPWNAELKTEAEWESLARHRLGSVYGATVEDWTMQSSRTAPEGPRVVCAADRPMLEALGERVGAAGAALVSVQPYLMAAFNRVRARIGRESCWLVLEERGRLTLALFHAGAWQAIRGRRADERWQSLLPEILEREEALLGLEEPCTQAFVYSEAEIESWSAGTYRFVDLTLGAGSGEGDRPFAMALG